jgi:hypothetical protein
VGIGAVRHGRLRAVRILDGRARGAPVLRRRPCDHS